MGTKTKLVEKVALVLVGLGPVGKTTLAKEIAAQHGKFLQIDAKSLEDRSFLEASLADRPNVLIIEGSPSIRVWSVVKNMITEDFVIGKANYCDPIRVKPPHLIFCVQVFGHFFTQAFLGRLNIVRLGGGE